MTNITQINPNFFRYTDSGDTFEYVVIIDLDKFSHNNHFVLDRDKGDKVHEGKVRRIMHRLSDEGNFIEIPTVSNGRHRIVALRDLGFKIIPIAVGSEEAAKKLHQLYGVTEELFAKSSEIEVNPPFYSSEGDRQPDDDIKRFGIVYKAKDLDQVRDLSRVRFVNELKGCSLLMALATLAISGFIAFSSPLFSAGLRSSAKLLAEHSSEVERRDLAIDEGRGIKPQDFKNRGEGPSSTRSR